MLCCDVIEDANGLVPGGLNYGLGIKAVFLRKVSDSVLISTWNLFASSRPSSDSRTRIQFQLLFLYSLFFA